MSTKEVIHKGPMTYDDSIGFKHLSYPHPHSLGLSFLPQAQVEKPSVQPPISPYVCRTNLH